MRQFRIFHWLGLATLLTLGAVALPAATLTRGQPASDAAQATTAATSVVPTLAPGITKQRMTFQSDGLTLVGYLYTPSTGQGPFPGLIWNHGSEKSPGTGPEFDSIADIFVPAGYVVFNPVRRGHGDSQGQYIDDQFNAEKQAHGIASAEALFVKLMSTEQLDDQLAGLKVLKSQPDVDTNRLGVIGCSYGGIQTLLGAESGQYKAAVAISPGAESWASKPLQQRLLQAVDNIKVPVLLIHPEHDASVGPGYTLGPEFQKLNKPYGLDIIPPYGPADQQGHCFGGAVGIHLIGPDALTFFSNELK